MSGARPFRPAVAVLALNAVARRRPPSRRPCSPPWTTRWPARSATVHHPVLRPDSGVATRLYSNLPDAYPRAAATVMPGPWTDTVLARGECYIGYTPDDLRSVFADHG